MLENEGVQQPNPEEKERVAFAADYQKLEGILHQMEREAIMAIVNNKDFQFGTVLGLQMNLRAVIELESTLLTGAHGWEATLKREGEGYVNPIQT